MARYANIINNRIHWILNTSEPFKKVTERYPSYIKFIDVSNVSPAPQEGWSYDAKAELFSPPVTPAVDMDSYKADNIAFVNEDCGNILLQGMYSTALGEKHKYDSDLVDQLNFAQAMDQGRINYDAWKEQRNLWLAAKAADPNYSEPEPVEKPVMYRIWNTDDTTKGWYPHTYENLLQAFSDMGNYKAAMLYKCSLYKEAIAAATTPEEVDAVIATIDWTI